MGVKQLDFTIRISYFKQHFSRLFKTRKHSSTLHKPSDSSEESTRIVYRIRSIADQHAIYIRLHSFPIQSFRFFSPKFYQRVSQHKKAKFRGQFSPKNLRVYVFVLCLLLVFVCKFERILCCIIQIKKFRVFVMYAFKFLFFFSFS